MATAAGIDRLVSVTIDSVVNGVSQQPPTVRFPSQCEAQDNMLSKISDGAVRRPPTEYVALLHTGAVPAKGYHTHLRARDVNTQHVILIEDGNIRVFNLATGVEGTITDTSGTYLDITGAAADAAFSVVSVADHTFVVNKETVVAMSGNVTAVRKNEFLVYLQEGIPSGARDQFWAQQLGSVTRTQKVAIGGAGTFPDELRVQLLVDIYSPAHFPRWGFTFPAENPNRTVIYGKQTTDLGNVDLIEDPSWGYSDEVYSFIGPTTQKFADLPSRAPDGFITEIVGVDGNDENNYWVERKEGVRPWVETVGPNQDNEFDASTMPHVLVQTGADAFTFGPQTWADREKGDADSAPEPGFVGKTIADLVFHKNRLGFLWDESANLSEAGEFFNFWPTTVTTVVDSDPIEAAGTNNRIAILDYAIPFDKRLFLFSGEGAVQNVLEGGDALTVQNAEISEASAFPASEAVRPQSSGKALYFITDRGVASGLFEYTISDLAIADADEVTSHVPTYIPGNVSQLSISQKASIISVLSTDTADKLYIYSFFFDNRAKVQSSWSRWIFHTTYTILGASWIGEILYLVVSRPDGVHLEKINTQLLVDGALKHRVHLDSLEQLTGVYTVSDNLTRWTTTYDSQASDGNFRAILSDAGWGAQKGSSINLSPAATSNVLFAEGNFSAFPAHIGRTYLSDYEFTKPGLFLPASDTTRGSEPVTQGRLQIGNFKVLVRNSAGFEARVSSDEVNPDEILAEQEEFVYEYPGKIVDMSTIGPTNPRPVDEFTFEVGMESKHARIRITSDSHLPLTLVGAEWEGRYVARAARI